MMVFMKCHHSNNGRVTVCHCHVFLLRCLLPVYPYLTEQHAGSHAGQSVILLASNDTGRPHSSINT